MTEAEKSNERQVAYAKILDVIRNMPGRRTVANAVSLIVEISNKDDAWKQLPKS
jgi:hypothetical protein